MTERPPELNPYFYYGNILSYDFIGNIIKDRGKYRFQLRLTYGNEKTYSYQQGGFEKKQQAKKARDQVVHDLVEGSFCPFRFNLQEMSEYWLFDYSLKTKKITYNTFYSYKSILYNHFLKKMNGKLKIRNITEKQLERFLKPFDGYSLRKNAEKVITGIFALAYERHYISFNPAPIAIKNVRIIKPLSPTKRNITWSVEQIQYALCVCKDNFPKIYMPFLLSLMLGTRLSETIGLKYSDIDFKNKNIFIYKQLGYQMDPNTFKKEKTDIPTKTINGIRDIPIPDWVLDEIIVSRAVYEKNRARVPDFQDNDFICCNIDGSPYNKASIDRHFKKLLKCCGYDNIHWHDLRHIYSTVLSFEVNIKAVSIFLGHKSEDFTKKAYIADKKIIHDSTMMETFWEFVKPKEILNKPCINIQNCKFEMFLPEEEEIPKS